MFFSLKEEELSLNDARKEYDVVQCIIESSSQVRRMSLRPFKISEFLING